jgi:hypothetical protein
VCVPAARSMKRPACVVVRFIRLLLVSMQHDIDMRRRPVFLDCKLVELHNVQAEEYSSTFLTKFPIVSPYTHSIDPFSWKEGIVYSLSRD